MHYIPPTTAIVEQVSTIQKDKKQLTSELYDAIAEALDNNTPKVELLASIAEKLNASWKLDLFRDLYSMLWSNKQVEKQEPTIVINGKNKADILLADYFQRPYNIEEINGTKAIITTKAKKIEAPTLSLAIFKLLKKNQ